MITVVANLKGGAGKSTVTFNLAVWLRQMGRRVAVIDLDPQRNLVDVAAMRMEEGIEPTIPVEAGPFSDVTLPDNVDEILIDVGTADLGSFKQAIMIADRILIPVTPSQADIWSTQRFVRFLYKNTHGNPPEAITFLNRVDTDKKLHATDEAAEALNTLPGIRLLPQRLSHRPVFRDSFSESLAVFELEPRSLASREMKELAEALYGPARRSVLDRLRNQKRSSTLDSALGEALKTPAGEPRLTKRIGFEDAMPTLAGDGISENRGEAKPGKKRHAVESGKKRKKGDKEKKRDKNAKRYSDKNEKKSGKTRDGKKAKKRKKQKKNGKRSSE